MQEGQDLYWCVGQQSANQDSSFVQRLPCKVGSSKLPKEQIGNLFCQAAELSLVLRYVGSSSPSKSELWCFPIHSPAHKGSSEMAVLCGWGNSPAQRGRHDLPAVTWFQQIPAWQGWASEGHYTKVWAGCQIPLLVKIFWHGWLIVEASYPGLQALLPEMCSTHIPPPHTVLVSHLVLTD